MKKGSIWGCINTSKVESKPYSVLAEKPKLRYKFKTKIVKDRRKEHLIIRTRRKGIWHIPDNF